MEFSTLIGVIGVLLFLIWMVDAIGGVQNTRHPSRSIDTVRFITGRNEVLAKVIFLHLSVIHSVHRGGEYLTRHPPQDQTSPGPDPPGPDTPQADTPRADTPRSRHPPEADTPRDTANARPVRILLECILVYIVCWCML